MTATTQTHGKGSQALRNKMNTTPIDTDAAIEESLVEIMTKSKEWIDLELEFRKKFYAKILGELEKDNMNMDNLLILSEAYKNLNNAVDFKKVIEQVSKVNE